LLKNGEPSISSPLSTTQTGIDLVSPGIKTGLFLFDSCNNLDILASKLLLKRLKSNSLL